MTSFHSVRKNSRIMQDISLCLLYPCQSSIFDERGKLGDQVNTSSLLVHCPTVSQTAVGRKEGQCLLRSLGQPPHSLCCDFGGNKTFTTRWSKFEPLFVICQTFQRLFQKTIEGLEGKINAQALGATLGHSLGGLDRQAQIQGVSQQAAVAAGSDLPGCSLEENMLPLL